MLHELLQKIEELDTSATKGPWDHTVEWAEIGSGSDSVIHGYGYAHCEGCDEEVESVDARVALSPEDAEFIALSRTAMPALAQAVRAVLEMPLMARGEDEAQYAYNLALRRAKESITKVLGGDDAA